MRAKYAWLLVPVLAVAAWLLLRDRSEATGMHETSAAPVAPNRPASTPVVDRATPGAPAHLDRGVQLRSAAVHGSAVSAPAPAVAINAPAPRSLAAAPPAPTPPAPTPPAPARSEDANSGGKLADKTGWSDHSVANQLNKEFMPLASECIIRAKDRKPFLEGLLSFTMVISPTQDGKAVVSALKVHPDNKIQDPELWECIRESSFALEGLKAPHDFDISMPIPRDDPG